MFNKENLKYFNNPQEADNWIWRIENGVSIWVSKKGKSYWYLVEWESKRQGTLRKDINHEDFARLLVEECKDALLEKDTQSRIFHNIQSFKFKDELSKYLNDTLLSGHVLRKDIKEVSDLLTKDIPPISATVEFTLEKRMKEFLDEEAMKADYAKVCVRPVYNGKTVTLSLERYMSQRFMDERKPSQKIIYECVEEKLTEEIVEMYSGRFCQLDNTKLFIASTHRFTADVMNEASIHHIGLVLVNPQNRVTEYDFVLPRSRCDQVPDELMWKKMLVGEAKMSEQILIYDQGRIDNSLSFAFYKYASFDKKKLFVAAPVLCDAEIEEKALQLVKPQVDYYVTLLSQCRPSDKVPQCIIDPYWIAQKMGLTVNRGKTGNKLGRIAIAQKRVTLTNRLEYDDPEDRFSMSHEIGHHTLHHDVIEEAQDGNRTIASRNKEWMEHHANYFASCLLMPAPVIRMLYNIYWKKWSKREQVSPLKVKKNYYSDKNFQSIVGPIARKMNVSLKAAYIRLKKLGLIIDEEQ